ncbi:MAG: DEAD/DEAH box helicase [Candidatus Saccharicenans sp.]
MSIFQLHNAVINDYSKYIQSFFSILDDRIRQFVEEAILKKNELWPDVLIQLNPSFQYAETIEELVNKGKLHKLCAEVFRNKDGTSIRLFRHQQEAIEKALNSKHFIITSGTGSGKTLTYLIPIINKIASDYLDSHKVIAIIIYPMNALVNSQYDALVSLANQYKARTGEDLQIRFAKYTGQETLEEKTKIQTDPPHILLTNYVMAELMLVRPEEHNLVDKATSALEFLVIDEIHTYRGRQGADVGLLIRRLRQRSGNKNLLCIGTSATMVAGKATSKIERQEEVARFAERLFGIDIDPHNVIEETLTRITNPANPVTPEILKKSLTDFLPADRDSFVENPITIWIEENFGIIVEADGTLRRRTPISLDQGAKKLSELTGIKEEICRQRLQEFFLLGAQLKTDEGFPLFAFKLHQFFGQGRTVYSTLEVSSKRILSLEGAYYAPGKDSDLILFPLQFCRVCGQEYYAVFRNLEQNSFSPYDPSQEIDSVGEVISGYLMIAPDDGRTTWDAEHLPPEWFDHNGRLKRDYKKHVPEVLYVRPNATYSFSPEPQTLRVWFQPKPFLLCLNCGEYYTRRDKFDFKKLVGLATEGRSTSTTILSISALKNAHEGGIPESRQKILSFTDNRQDASLQAGHFNDFVMVSVLRAGILSALEKYQRLQFDRIAKEVASCLGVELADIAINKSLRKDSPQGREAWQTFEDLIEYRIYEDLRRGWRVIQPNLEQCGLLSIEYKGLDELCGNDTNWTEIDALRELSSNKRKEILSTMLDHFRRKLAISARCLEDTYQSQLRKRVDQYISERWGFDETDYLRKATRFVLPGGEKFKDDDLSLSETTLIARYIRRNLTLDKDYDKFIEKLLELLNSFGIIKITKEKQTKYAQIDSSCLIWCACDRESLPPDPIYSGRVNNPQFQEAAKKANKYFREFYRQQALFLKRFEGQPHSAQVRYEDRLEREHRFREGKLSCLFCSPTMELGIDISDLQLLHLRNVPPTPANYAQRSGRSGRRGDPALVMTYCAAGSGHDQYFFRHREEMVAGVVRPPRIDLNNEDLVRAHVHAIWLAHVGLSLKNSIADILEIALPGYPLRDSIKTQLRLSQSRLEACIAEAETIIKDSGIDEANSDWYSKDWLRNIIIRAPEEFDRAFDRWRELYKAADVQWQEASEKLRHPIRDKAEKSKLEAQRREAERQKSLLCNYETTREESDFYPYRYLASEGFLPGYNFPRLPVRAYIPRGQGEFISRPRFLAITEFGPKNIIYHEGAKYESGRLVIPPGGLESRILTAKICKACGYFQSNILLDLCENCNSQLDASSSEIVNLLEMPNVKTWKRERISCDEEERRRLGYEITTHFRFAPAPGGQKRSYEAFVKDESGELLLHLIYAPAAEVFRINHGWLNRRDKGFLINLMTGEWEPQVEDEELGPSGPSDSNRRVSIYVRDTHNILLVYLSPEVGKKEADFYASLQYCLQRGIEQIFQVEEIEISSQRIGSGDHKAILFYEASEGGVGVLRRVIQERDILSQVAAAALERCHFNLKTFEDQKPNCSHACFECLLTYNNQKDHSFLNRHIVKSFLIKMLKCTTELVRKGRDYHEHYRWLRSLTDSRSELERKFIDYLYKKNRRLPDDAQKNLADYDYCIPDFFYEPNCCIFCDGSVHDDPEQKSKDDIKRNELKQLGYRVIVIRYDQDLEEQIQKYPDIFGESKK